AWESRASEAQFIRVTHCARLRGPIWCLPEDSNSEKAGAGTAHRNVSCGRQGVLCGEADREMTHTDQRLLPLVVLETERLRLRALLESDVDDVYKACSDPELQKWLPIPRPGVPYTREDAELWCLRDAPSMRTSG